MFELLGPYRFNPASQTWGTLGADWMSVFAELVQYHSAAGEMQKECGPFASSGVTTSLRSIMRHPTCPSSQGWGTSG